MKTAIVIPYRNRRELLDILLDRLAEYLRNNSPHLDYKIIISEQVDNGLFNRGLSLNVGAKYAINTLNFDHIIAHDVDIIPVKNVNYAYRGFCSDWFVNAGGLNCMAYEFLHVNGYSNDYRGWGFEDIDIVRRFLFYNVNILAWKYFATKEKPTLVNMEWIGVTDSGDKSRKYWGKAWPRFLTPAEHGLPEITVDKTIQWYSDDNIDNNKQRLDSHASLPPDELDAAYGGSGINQIKLYNLGNAISFDRIEHIQYTADDMV